MFQVKSKSLFKRAHNSFFKKNTNSSSLIFLRNYPGVNGGLAKRPEYYKSLTLQPFVKKEPKKKILRKKLYGDMHSPGPYSKYHPNENVNDKKRFSSNFFFGVRNIKFLILSEG